MHETKECNSAAERSAIAVLDGILARISCPATKIGSRLAPKVGHWKVRSPVRLPAGAPDLRFSGVDDVAQRQRSLVV